jgi:hypothetical protein
MRYCAKVRAKGVIFFGIGTTLREGSREYFYSNLDKNFPGIKSLYERNFGNKYEIESPNSYNLYRIIKSTCAEHGMLCGVKDNFEYLTDFPEPIQLKF